MDAILKLLVSINFWTIVAGVASVVAIVFTAIMWRQSHKKEVQSPNSADLSRIEFLVSNLESILKNLGMQSPSEQVSADNPYALAANKSAGEIIDLLRAIKCRPITRSVTSDSCEQLYQELRSQFNTRMFNFDRIRDRVRGLRYTIDA